MHNASRRRPPRSFVAILNESNAPRSAELKNLENSIQRPALLGPKLSVAEFVKLYPHGNKFRLHLTVSGDVLSADFITVGVVVINSAVVSPVDSARMPTCKTANDRIHTILHKTDLLARGTNRSLPCT